APTKDPAPATGASAAAGETTRPARGTRRASSAGGQPQLDLSDLTAQRDARETAGRAEGGRTGQDRPRSAQPKSDQRQRGGGDQQAPARPKQNGDRRNDSQGSAVDGSGRGQQNQGRRPSLDDIQLPEGRPADAERSEDSRPGRGDDDRPSGRRRRGRDRYRDRDRKRRGREVEEEIEITEDDVLLPVAGVLDILENYAFVRTSGYLPGANDVYVSLGQVKKYGLRRGDAVTGAVRQPREGESNHRQKFNALV